MAFSIVIIQSDREEAAQLAQCFEAYNCIIAAIGSNGREALELARAHRPDILLLDPFLPYFNCDEIAEQLELAGFRRMVKIAISDEKNDRMAERFLSGGGDLFLVRPIDYAYCLKRMEKYHQLRSRQDHFELEDSPHRAAVRRLQLQMNMPISITGFLYIQEAVVTAMENPQALHRITKIIYPNVSIRFHTAPKNVERCIRRAIENTFEQGEISMLQQYFAHFLDNERGKPNNKEFIGYLAELAKDYMISHRSFSNEDQQHRSRK